MLRAVIAVVFMFLVSVYFAVRHGCKHRGRIHFSPDLNELGWCESIGEQIEVRISGEFTYEGPAMLHVLQIFLEGTEPVNFFADITPLESAATFNLSELFLDKLPRRVVALLILKSPVVHPTEVLKRRLIFRDDKGREFKLRRLEVPYESSLRKVNADGKIRLSSAGE